MEGPNGFVRCLILVLALLVGPGFVTRAAVVNISNIATPYTDYSLWVPGNWNIAMLTDGDRQASFHLDVEPGPGAEYYVDLGRAYPVHSLRLFPRQDGCCPNRFSDLRVSIHADGGGTPGTEAWGTDLFTDGTNPGSGAGTVVEVAPPAPVSGRWIRIRSLADNPVDYALQMTELEIFAEVPESEINRALDTLATSNRPLFGNASPALLVNGNRGRQAVHGLEEIEPGFAYTIDLGTEVDLNRIEIWARQDDCCPERLSNFRVSIHEAADGEIGAAVWSADRFTDFSNPGSFAGARDTLTAALDPAGRFRGRWIRIESLDDPVPRTRCRWWRSRPSARGREGLPC